MHTDGFQSLAHAQKHIEKHSKAERVVVECLRRRSFRTKLACQTLSWNKLNVSFVYSYQYEPMLLANARKTYVEFRLRQDIYASCTVPERRNFSYPTADTHMQFSHRTHSLAARMDSNCFLFKFLPTALYFADDSLHVSLSLPPSLLFSSLSLFLFRLYLLFRAAHNTLCPILCKPTQVTVVLLSTNLCMNSLIYLFVLLRTYWVLAQCRLQVCSPFLFIYFVDVCSVVGARRENQFMA